MDFLLLTVFIVVVISLIRSFRVVQQDHRLVVLRLGRFLGIRGPGTVLLFPLVDRAYDIDLTQAVPEWRGLTESELRNRIMDASGINNPAS